MPAPPRSRLAVAVLLALFLVGCGGDDRTGSPAATEPGGSPPGTVPSGAPAASGEPGPTLAAPDGGWGRIPEIVEAVRPSVVTVFRDGGLGSGVVWSADGIVVTNHHVVEGTREVEVAFADGGRSPGEVLASDPRSDLAVIRTERTDLPAATFAEEPPEIGSLAIAIGSPLGFELSVTAGVVSGLNRAIPGAAQRAPALVDLLQTDAPISPGNSGGALVGADGRIIGINVAYIPPEARAVALGFAIPASTVIDVVEALLEDGSVEHAYLGVQMAPLTRELAARFGLDRDAGALVIDVQGGGPADSAGIRPGDLIVGIGDTTVDAVEDVLGVLRQRRPGDEIVVRIVRDGAEEAVSVTLGTLPS